MGVKLGQKWAVKDGNLLASNQVGSRFFNKQFDFSRASNGTYVDRDGLLKTAELYNNISYSQDLSNSAWAKTRCSLGDKVLSPNKSISAYKIIPDTQNAKHEISISVSPYTTATVSLFAKAAEKSRLQITKSNWGTTNFDLLNETVTSGTGTIEDVGNGWYRCSASYTASSSQNSIYIIVADDDGSVSYSGNNSDGIYFWGIQLVEGTEPLDYQYTNGLQGLPRISFEDGVGHLLLEPQRSNLLLQSNSFDTSWAALSTGSVVSGQSGIYGSNDAWELTATSSGGNIFQSNSNSGTQTFSVYAKSDGSTGIRLYAFGSVNANAYFNLNTGVVLGASNTIASSIESVGNGWYRCSISFNQTNTGLRFYTSNNSTSLAAGSVYIQHAQLESGSYPTSIIETTTSAVTRLADVANNCGSEQDFNSEEGVLYAEIAALNDGGINRSISITDGTFDEVVLIRMSSDVGRFQAFLRSGGGVLDSLSSVGNVQTDNNKIAIVYKTSEFSMWLNGTKVSTITPTAMPVGLNTLGFDWVSGGNFYGKVRNLQVFTEALSDAELQQLTS